MSIEDLRKQIESLKKQIKERKNEKETLETNLCLRDQEVDSEKERVKTLKKEIEALKKEKVELKKTLHDEETKHRAKITVLERRVDWLEKRGALAFKDNKIKQLEEQKELMQKNHEKTESSIHSRMDNLELELKSSFERIAELEKKKDEFDIYKAKTDDLVNSRKLICIGQLSGKWMEAIYREILPEYFPDDEDDGKYKQPHLWKFAVNVQKLYPKDPKKEKELNGLWRKKKEKMGLDYVNRTMDEARRFEFMKSTYLEILPEYIIGKDRKSKPEFHDIEKDIKSTYPKDKKTQDEKISKWKEKLERIGFKIVEYMEEEMKRRNNEAHPDPLEEKELQEISKAMPGEGKSFVEDVIRQLKYNYPVVWEKHFISLK